MLQSTDKAKLIIHKGAGRANRSLNIQGSAFGKLDFFLLHIKHTDVRI